MKDNKKDLKMFLLNSILILAAAAVTAITGIYLFKTALPGAANPSLSVFPLFAFIFQNREEAAALILIGLFSSFSLLIIFLNFMMVKSLSEGKARRETTRSMDLIRFVTHELKGILSSTMLNTYAVRDGLLGMSNFKQQQAIDAVARNLEYFDSTIKTFFDLSRIEDDQISPNYSDVHLKKEIVDFCIASHSNKPGGLENTIINNIQPDIIVNTDRDLLCVVMNNLITNALKYGKKAGMISISAAKHGDYVEIVVFNEGTPLPESRLEKIFEKYYRNITKENKNVKGTGLGLYITRKIITRLGGTITARPEPDGNTFIFTIRR